MPVSAPIRSGILGKLANELPRVYITQFGLKNFSGDDSWI
jgi:hypothetical protein